MSQPRNCSFPCVENERYTNSLDLLTFDSKGLPDFLTVLLSNIEDSFQHHGWKAGIDYTIQDIIAMSAAASGQFLNHCDTFNKGYQNIPSEKEERDWRKRRNEYLLQLKSKKELKK